jgi:hypothetical protein
LPLDVKQTPINLSINHYDQYLQEAFSITILSDNS